MTLDTAIQLLVVIYAILGIAITLVSLIIALLILTKIIRRIK